MACADTAMVIAVSFALGEFRNMTAIGQTISFMRPIANSDGMIEARVLKLGRSIVFGEVSMMAGGQDAVAAHATTTYALIT
jgi:acyl-coenzyme A thioesterase PaaI-like protein